MQCSMGFHTHVMSSQPTVIILAEPDAEPARSSGGAAMPLGPFDTLGTLLRKVVSAEWPVLLVAPPGPAQAALSLLPQKDILVAPEPPALHPPGDWLVRAMAAGVMARSLSPGWVIVPGDMPMLQVDTLHVLARNLVRAPILYPSHRHVRGQPVALASELYSELIRLDSEADLRRLTARYPAQDIEVDDPGIHMGSTTLGALDQWRAQVGGPLAPTLRRPVRHFN